jgi:MFS family permease
VSIVTLLGYSLSGSPIQVAVFRTLAGAGFGLKYAALVVLTDRLVARHLRNTGQTLMQMAQWSVGPVLGPAVGGFIYVTLGPSSLFAGSAVLATAGAMLSWWALRGVGRADG